MESFFARYRNLLVLLAILLAQIVGLAVQVRRSETGRNVLDSRDGTGVRLVRLWANAFVSPPERVIQAAKLGAAACGGLSRPAPRSRTKPEYAEDHRPVRLEEASLLEDARQGQRLQGILNFQQKYIYKTLAAQAIGSSGSDQSRVFLPGQGLGGRAGPGYGGDYGGGDCRQGARRLSAFGAGAGHQRPDQRRGSDSWRPRGFAAFCAVTPPGNRRLWASCPTSASSRAKRC